MGDGIAHTRDRVCTSMHWWGSSSEGIIMAYDRYPP